MNIYNNIKNKMRHMNDDSKAILRLTLFALGLAAFTFLVFVVLNVPQYGNKKLNLGEFSVVVPKDWQYIQEQGIDSFVGSIEGKDMKLTFNYGWYSSSSIGKDIDNYIVVHEEIDGRSAVIHYPKDNKKGTTGIFIENIDKLLDTQSNRFSMHGKDLSKSQIQTALQIFRSLDF